MSEEVSYIDWLRTRQKACDENRIRAQAFFDQNPNDGLWTWLRDAYTEIAMIYSQMENNENNRFNDLRVLLGLNRNATLDEMNDRAKVLGNLLQKIVDDAKRIEEETEEVKQLKDRVFRE